MSYEYYNPNPAGRSVGDCAVRAISKVLGQSWDDVYAGLALEGFAVKDMPDGDTVWGRYLKRSGFSRHVVSDDCPDCYTVGKFAEDHPAGSYILSMPGRHVVAVADGVIYDSWDSQNEIPAYYWTKEG